MIAHGIHTEEFINGLFAGRKADGCLLCQREVHTPMHVGFLASESLVLQFPASFRQTPRKSTLPFVVRQLWGNPSFSPGGGESQLESSISDFFDLLFSTLPERTLLQIISCTDVVRDHPSPPMHGPVLP